MLLQLRQFIPGGDDLDSVEETEAEGASSWILPLFTSTGRRRSPALPWSRTEDTDGSSIGMEPWLLEQRGEELPRDLRCVLRPDIDLQDREITSRPIPGCIELFPMPGLQETDQLTPFPVRLQPKLQTQELELSIGPFRGIEHPWIESEVRRW